MKNKSFSSIAATVLFLIVFIEIQSQSLPWIFEHRKTAIVKGIPNCQFFDDSLYTNFSPYAPVFLDWNQDGLLDVLCGTSTGKIAYWQNIGTPKNPCFKLVSNNFGNMTAPNGYAAPSFGDLDLDGKPDLVCGTGIAGGYGGTVLEYRNIGTLEQPEFKVVEDTIAGVDVHDASVPFLVDFDGNGTLDIFVAGGLGKVVHIKNIGTPKVPKWGKPITILSGGAFRRSPVVVDIDCDSKLELLLSDAYGTVTKYENTSTKPDTAIWEATSGAFAGMDDCPNEGGCLVRPTVGDIDGDGDLDWLFGAGSLRLYLNNSPNPCDPQLTLEYAAFPHIGISDQIDAFFDTNGDGLVECFLINFNYNGVSHWGNNGKPSEPNWVLKSTDFFGNGLPYRSIRFFDADQDGDHDAMAILSNKIVLLRNQTGKWTQESNLVFDNLPINNQSRLIVNDINKDGVTDLLISMSNGKLLHFIDTDSAAAIFWNFQTEYFIKDLPTFLYAPSSIDFDRDGAMDLVYDYFDKIYWYRNSGSGFESKIIPTTGVKWDSRMMVADILPDCGPELFSLNKMYVFKGVKPVITAMSSSFFFLADTLIQIKAIPMDTNLGAWSGNGVNKQGQFNPSVAGLGTHLIVYTYTDSLYGCISLSDTIALFVKEKTIAAHTSPSDAYQIEISPNPTTGQFTISWDGPPSNSFVSVYDTNSRLISQQQGNFTALDIDLSGTASGIYLILVKTEGFTVWRKVSKK